MMYQLILLSLVLALGLEAQITSRTARRLRYGTALPATCNETKGEVFFKTSATIAVYFCSATDTWTAMGASGGSVGGGANLVTVGAIPYVCVAGELCEDSPGIHWDPANDRLGLGTATPAGVLEIATTVGNSALHIDAPSALDAIIILEIADTPLWALGLDGGTNSFRINNAGAFGTALFTILFTDEVGIGLGNLTPTGTLDVLDRTATTGATKVCVGCDATNTSATTTTLIVQEGDVQSTTNLLDVQANGGSTVNAINAAGLLDTYNSQVTAGVGQPYILGNISTTGLTAAVSTANIVASATAGLYRVAGYMQTTTASTGVCTSDVTIGWTYNSSAKTLEVVSNHDQNTDETYSQIPPTIVRIDASINLTYAISLDAGGGDCTNVVFDAYLVAERIQ